MTNNRIGISVAQAIEQLSKLDPNAYLFLDDGGIGREIVEITDQTYRSSFHDGTEVNVVYLIWHGQLEEAERMRNAMADYVNKTSPMGNRNG